jgi:hypothetical protein
LGLLVKPASVASKTELFFLIEEELSKDTNVFNLIFETTKGKLKPKIRIIKIHKDYLVENDLIRPILNRDK